MFGHDEDWENKPHLQPQDRIFVVQHSSYLPGCLPTIVTVGVPPGHTPEELLEAVSKIDRRPTIIGTVPNTHT